MSGFDGLIVFTVLGGFSSLSYAGRRARRQSRWLGRQVGRWSIGRRRRSSLVDRLSAWAGRCQNQACRTANPRHAKFCRRCGTVVGRVPLWA